MKASENKILLVYMNDEQKEYALEVTNKLWENRISCEVKHDAINKKIK